MRFIVTGELGRNRLLQIIILLYALYVAGLWVTNTLLYFSKMGLSYASVVAYYLGSEESFLAPRSYQGLLEVSHYHLFAMIAPTARPVWSVWSRPSLQASLMASRITVP